MTKGKPAAIARESIADRVRDILTERIVDGTYSPGTRLVEMRIARELNVSQAPVREALCALEAARFVETQPYRGTRVRRVGERERLEARQVRAVLEELAAQLGAARLRARLRELRTEADSTLAAAKRGDIFRYLKHNLRFHQMIVEAADSAVLLRTWESLAFTIGARLRASRAPRNMSAIAAEHRRIIDALARGDVRSAGRLLRRHTEVLLDATPEDNPSTASLLKSDSTTASRPSLLR